MPSSDTNDGRSVLSMRTAHTLRSGADRPAVEFHGQWSSSGDLDRFSWHLHEALTNHCRGCMRIGLVVQNTPVNLAAIMSLIANNRSIVMINGAQRPERLATELAALNIAAVAAQSNYWDDFVLAAVKESAAARIILPDVLDGPIEVYTEGWAGPGPNGDRSMALELLRSATTGAPKRIPIKWQTLSEASGAAHGTPLFVGGSFNQLAGTGIPPATSGLFLGNVGGIYMVLPSALTGQRIVLLENSISTNGHERCAFIGQRFSRFSRLAYA
jgi:long-chain acyl-CoA synthetase